MESGNLSSLLDAILKMVKEELTSPNVTGLNDSNVVDININTTPTCPNGSVLAIGMDNKCGT
jgi:hypothetical protein